MHDPAIPPGSSCSLSVLIVEDEVLIAIDLETMLRDNGHEVAGTAASVGDASELLEDLRPDIAVLDVNLRGRSVVSVALRLHEIAVPFVLASGYSPNEMCGGDVLSGAVNVGKPFNENRLFQALHQAIAAE